MSNKVILSIVLSLVCLAVLAFFTLKKNIPNEANLTKELAKKNKKPTRKPKAKTIYQQVIVEENPDTDTENGDQFDKVVIKNNRKPYRTRTIVYSDPVNDRILGDPKWAATTSKAELEHVEKAFETAPEDPTIISLSRQQSIDAIKPVVNKCYQELLVKEPTAKGRIALEWLARSSGEISNVKLGANVDLRFPSFTTCILTRTRNLKFETSAEDIFVEYPFAFL